MLKAAILEWKILIPIFIIFDTVNPFIFYHFYAFFSSKYQKQLINICQIVYLKSI